MTTFGVRLTVGLCLFSLFCTPCLSAAINTLSPKTGAVLYLMRFGYFPEGASNPRTSALMDGNTIRQAILSFQNFANIPATGVADSETIAMMNTPRCGVRDKVGKGSDARRKKRYALQGSRWRLRELTYKITRYPSGASAPSKGEVKLVFKRSFEVWSKVANVTFTEANEGEKVHIDIRFESGEHGDGDPFDGVGGTLAHAYFPIYGGDAHFDDTEVWTIDSYKGTNLFQVAGHEIGHSLGLSHSDVPSSFMAPFYRGYTPTFKLHSDDIQGIQSLYGKRSDGETTIITSAPKPSDDGVKKPSPGASSPLCLDPNTRIDAIVSMENKNTFVFKGDDLYLLTDDGIAVGYPRKVQTDIEGFPVNIDAAFTWTNGKTYVFKGSNYWRLTGMVIDKDYPKPISKGFAGIPSDVNAAIVWSGNGKIYFFKNNQYWRFDPTSRPPVKAAYPKDITNWEGVPNNIDAALQYTNGYTYFFKQGQYWRFNDRAFRVDTADPNFPRRTGKWWFGCGEEGSNLQVTPDLQSDPRRSDIAVAGADDVSGSDDAVRNFFRNLFG